MLFKKNVVYCTSEVALSFSAGTSYTVLTFGMLFLARTCNTCLKLVKLVEQDLNKMFFYFN